MPMPMTAVSLPFALTAGVMAAAALGVGAAATYVLAKRATKHFFASMSKDKIITESNWWMKLSDTGQDEYLRQHPKSRKRKGQK